MLVLLEVVLSAVRVDAVSKTKRRATLTEEGWKAEAVPLAPASEELRFPLPDGFIYRAVKRNNRQISPASLADYCLRQHDV